MYHCWRCLHLISVSLNAFCQIISPPLPIIRKRYSGGENLIGAGVECEDLKDPYGYYKALGSKKIYSDEDIGVALKKANKCFFRLGRTWKVQQQNIHCVEELVLRGIQEASKNFQVQYLIHRSEAAREMGSNGGTYH